MFSKISKSFAILLLNLGLIQTCSNGRSDGETWRVGSFTKKCKVHSDGSWQISVASCFTPGGFELPVGESHIEGTRRFTCTRTGTGGAILNSQHANNNRERFPINGPRKATCSHNGQSKQDGETWRVGSFTMKCKVHSDGSWQTSVEFCFTPGGFKLPVGESHIEGTRRFTCTRTGTGGAILNSHK